MTTGAKIWRWIKKGWPAAAVIGAATAIVVAVIQGQQSIEVAKSQVAQDTRVSTAAAYSEVFDTATAYVALIQSVPKDSREAREAYGRYEGANYNALVYASASPSTIAVWTALGRLEGQLREQPEDEQTVRSDLFAVVTAACEVYNSVEVCSTRPLATG